MIYILENYFFNIYETETKYKKNYFTDITEEWLHKADTSIKEIKNAKYVIKNNKRYYVNMTNKIDHKNREVENAKWFVDLMGGKLVFLPTINEDGGVSCADYKYYPPHSNKWYYLDNKETTGKGLNVFYHSLEGKDNQSNIFLIDCTYSYLSNEEIYERLNLIFKSAETSYVDTVIIKNGKKLFGVFKKIKKEK